MIGIVYLVVALYPWALFFIGPAALIVLIRAKTDGKWGAKRIALIVIALVLEFAIFFCTRPYWSFPVIIGRYHGSASPIFAFWGAGLLLAAIAWAAILPTRPSNDQLAISQISAPLFFCAPFPHYLSIGDGQSSLGLVGPDFFIVAAILLGWYGFRASQFWRENGAAKYTPARFAKRIGCDLLPFCVFLLLTAGYSMIERESPYHLNPGANASRPW